MPARCSSSAISRSRSAAMRANSLIIDSICATPASSFLDVKTLQADERIPRFHHIETPKRRLFLQSFDNYRETISLCRIKVAASLPNRRQALIGALGRALGR